MQTKKQKRLQRNKNKKLNEFRANLSQIRANKLNRIIYKDTRRGYMAEFHIKQKALVDKMKSVLGIPKETVVSSEKLRKAVEYADLRSRLNMRKLDKMTPPKV